MEFDKAKLQWLEFDLLEEYPHVAHGARPRRLRRRAQRLATRADAVAARLLPNARSGHSRLVRECPLRMGAASRSADVTTRPRRA